MNEIRRPDLIAVVLAGGSSSRFGRDKASVDIRGTPSVQRVVDSLLAVAPRVFVAGGRGDLPAGAEARLPDPEPGGGPLQALAGVFTRFPYRDVLVFPCDVPLAAAKVLRELSRSLPDGIGARVPRVGGIPQPLTALYGPVAGAILMDAASRGRRSPIRQLEHIAVDWLESGERHGLDSLMDFDSDEELSRLLE